MEGWRPRGEGEYWTQYIFLGIVRGGNREHLPPEKIIIEDGQRGKGENRRQYIIPGIRVQKSNRKGWEQRTGRPRESKE